jgi:hypothetical protein
MTPINDDLQYHFNKHAERHRLRKRVLRKRMFDAFMAGYSCGSLSPSETINMWNNFISKQS